MNLDLNQFADNFNNESFSSQVDSLYAETITLKNTLVQVKDEADDEDQADALNHAVESIDYILGISEDLEQISYYLDYFERDSFLQQTERDIIIALAFKFEEIDTFIKLLKCISIANQEFIDYVIFHLEGVKLLIEVNVAMYMAAKYGPR